MEAKRTIAYDSIETLAFREKPGDKVRYRAGFRLEKTDHTLSIFLTVIAHDEGEEVAYIETVSRFTAGGFTFTDGVSPDLVRLFLTEAAATTRGLLMGLTSVPAVMETPMGLDVGLGLYARFAQETQEA